MTDQQAEAAKKRFLELFAQCGNVSASYRAAGVPVTTLYRWRNNDAEFGAAYRDAELEGTDRLEGEAFRRAHDGTEKPVYQGGKLVGTVREYSDLLLIFLLKARKPEMYRDRYDVHHSGEVPSVSNLTEEQRQAIRRIITD